jgi:hypothetical protein
MSARPPQDKNRRRSGRVQTEAGFTCANCHAAISSDPARSGVRNRNHCPHCLWSRHVDLEKAGDRLAGCNSRMRPVGLTVKSTRKKYGPERGELMLVHACTGCGKLSINRIAADDDPQALLSTYEGSFQMEPALRERLEADGIALLSELQAEEVYTQLFGKGSFDPAAFDAE